MSNEGTQTTPKEQQEAATPKHKEQGTHTPALKPHKSLLDDSEMISLKDSMKEEGFDLSSVEKPKLRRFAAYLKEYENVNAANENYAEAKFAKAASEDVRAVINGRAPQNAKDRDASQEEEPHIEDLKKSQKEALKQFDEETNQRRQKLNEEYEKQQQEFEDNWSNNMPPKYRKPSQKLLYLKSIEKSLASKGEYDQATIIKKEVDEQMKKETKQAQDKLYSDYCIAKSQLQQTHESKMDRFERNRSSERQFLIKQQGEDIERFHKRENVTRRKKMEVNTTSNKYVKRGGLYFSQPIKITPSTEGCLLPPLLTPNEIKQRKTSQTRRIQSSYSRRLRTNPQSAPPELQRDSNSQSQPTFLTSPADDNKQTN